MKLVVIIFAFAGLLAAQLPKFPGLPAAPANLGINVQGPPYLAVADWNGTTGTDNRAAFQAACDAVPATGGTVIFPAGAYKVSDVLVCSKTNLTLKSDGGLATLVFTKANTASVKMLTIAGTSGTRLANLTIDGMAFTFDRTTAPGACGGNCYLVYVDYVNGVAVRNSRFLRSDENALYVARSNNVDIHHNFVGSATYSAGSGDWIGAAGIVVALTDNAGDFGDVDIHHNFAGNVYDDAIFVTMQSAALTKQIVGVKVHHNTVRGAQIGNGIRVQSAKSPQITDNNISDTGSGGIVCDEDVASFACTGGTISQNRINNVGFTGGTGFHGINLTGAENMTVDGNYIGKTKGPSIFAAAPTIGVAANYIGKGIVASNNTIVQESDASGFGGGGITLQNLSDSSVHDNLIHNSAGNAVQFTNTLGADSYGLTASNNKLFNIKRVGSAGNTFGFYMYGSSTGKVYADLSNNDIFDSRGAAIIAGIWSTDTNAYVRVQGHATVQDSADYIGKVYWRNDNSASPQWEFVCAIVSDECAVAVRSVPGGTKWSWAVNPSTGNLVFREAALGIVATLGGATGAGKYNFGLSPGSVAFAGLAALTPEEGTQVYCSACTVAAGACATGAGKATATYDGASWRCTALP